MVTVVVLFVDYRDAAAGHTTKEEADPALRVFEEYLETSSYGQLNMELLLLHRWLRASHDHGQYGSLDALDLRSPDDVALGHDLAVEAAALADDYVDFNGVDVVMVVGPSSHFGGGKGGSYRSLAPTPGLNIKTVLVNDSAESGLRRAVGAWGKTALHEFLHLLGLVDLYPYVVYDAGPSGETAAANRADLVLAEFGLMGLRAWVPVPNAQDFEGYVASSEMLAWSRWQLGWLGAEQVRCVTENEATVMLGPVADPGSAAAMAAVPLSDTQMLVAESRRRTGYDTDMSLLAETDWFGVGYAPGPALVAEGVLVYTVDAAVESGALPIRLAYDAGNVYRDSYPVLSDNPIVGLGESVTVGGYTIAVSADDGDTHTVTISEAIDG